MPEETPEIPEDSSLHDLVDYIERGPEEIVAILGHIGERTEDGEWSRFDFEVLTFDGEKETIHVYQGDIGENDWMDIFDWINDLVDEYDVDYDNKYGEQ